MEFSFGDDCKDGPLTLGLHKKGSTYDVLTADDCKLVHEDMTAILSCVLDYFRTRKVGYYKKCSTPVICATCCCEEAIPPGKSW